MKPQQQFFIFLQIAEIIIVNQLLRMQSKIKKIVLPICRQEEKVEVYEEMKKHLQHILITLKQDKQASEKQQKIQTQLLIQETQQKQLTIQNLTKQNQQLKQQLQKLRKQFSQKINDLAELRREKQLLERKNVSTNNIITYLQTKNKQISQELYEAKKSIIIKRGQSGKEIKLKSCNKQHQHQTKYIFNKFDYQSIFEYTGLLDEDISIEILHKSQSSPNLQAITTTASSYVPKLARNHSSDLLNQLHQKEQKQFVSPDFHQFKLDVKKQTPLIKGSIKKISTLGHLLNLDSKKSLKESRKGKKISIDKDLQAFHKKKIETKSRVGSKNLEITKKAK